VHQAGALTGIRILRIYHSAVVDEYRHRERALRQRHGHDVHVVCPPAWREGSQLVRPGTDAEVPVHIVPVRGPAHPNLFWYRGRELGAVIRHLRPEIVDLQEEPFGLAVARALPLVQREAPNAKLCLYTAQNLPKRYPPPFSVYERRALAAAGAAYPCSTEAGQRLRARGFRGSVHVIPLGVTIPPAIRTPSGRVRVGFVGRLDPPKGAVIAVRAFVLAAAGRGASLAVIGSGHELEALRAEVSEAAISDQVEFTGAVSQDEALQRIAGLDVVMIPSLTTRHWKEQFGRVAVQAMAHGASVIASDSGALREVVADAGVLVPEGDVDGFARELGRLLDEPHRRAELSARGRIRAIEHFSWDVVADKGDRLYRELLAR
jgi:glycosyltransferase involved in cell wall biosynthesis